MSNTKPNVLDRSLTNMIVTSTASGIVAGLMSYLFLGETGSVSVFGYNMPGYVVTGELVMAGSLAGQFLSQKTIPNLKTMWPDWSDDTVKQVGDIVPSLFSGLSTIGAGVIALQSLPTLQGGFTAFAIGTGSYLTSEFLLDKLLYSESMGIDYS